MSVSTAHSGDTATAPSATPRVLIVEDDLDIQLLIRFAVPPDWGVACASTGAEALLLSREFDPDVVILDLGLPDMDGIDVLQALKSDEHMAWRPVVVLSAVLDRARTIDVLHAGAQDALQKPVPQELLEARLVAAQRVAAGHRAAETERLQREAALRAESAAEVRYRTALEAAPLAIAEVDLFGVVLTANEALVHLVGFDLIGRAFAELIVEGDHHLTETFATVRNGLRVAWTSQHQIRHNDGHLLTLVAHASVLLDADSQPTGVLMYLSDVTHHVAQLDELATRADTDPLTGALNRAGLEQLLDQVESHGEGVAVLFVDLDGFKAINDDFGHDAGDAVLRTVAKRLHSLGRSDDVLVRLGGDEFLIVCPHADPRAGGGLARRVVEVVRAPINAGNVVVQVGASVGVAAGRSIDVRQLVVEADASMYEMKRSGQGAPRR